MYRKKILSVTVSALLLTLASSPLVFAANGYTWTLAPNSFNDNQSSVAVSATGQYQIGVDYPGDIYVSSDYGSNWTDESSAGNNYWESTAVSSTGQFMVAGLNGGDLYLSNDYGSSWTDLSNAGSFTWNSLSISSNGQTIVGTHATNVISISKDGGATWSTITPTGAGASNLIGITMSSSGKYIQVEDASNNGYIYVSSDFGSIWQQTQASGNDGSPFMATYYTWSTISSSASGQYVVATASSVNGIYYSSNYGESWAEEMIPATQQIDDAIVSSNGQNILAVGDYVYESFDGGLTWITDSDLNSGGWSDIAAAGDFSQLVLANGHSVYLGANPSLIITPSTSSSSSSQNSAGSSQNNTPTVDTPDTGYGTPNRADLIAVSMLVTGSIVVTGAGLTLLYRKRYDM